ncbi:MAG: hypothetical protein ACPGQL_01905 [Thermoplasmatota archaeon]
MTRLAVAGLALLAPAPLIFAIRSLLEVAGRDPAAIAGLGPATGVSGALSLVGLGLLVAATWATAQRRDTLAGVVVVLLGHFVVSRVVDGDLGPAMVYLGTGLVASGAVGGRAWMAGSLAAAGALLRGFHDAGSLVVAAGALWLFVELVAAALRLRRHGASPDAA